MAARPIFPPRGQGPARGLKDGSVGTSEIADSAVITAKLGTNSVIGAKLSADSVGLTQVSLPVVRRTILLNLGSEVKAADNWPVLRGGAEAPQITACYVNTGNEIYHADDAADAWNFQLRNVSRDLSLSATGALMTGQTLAATAWKKVPIDLGNATLASGDSLQFQLTASGTAQTIDQLQVAIEFQPTVNV